MRTNVSMRTFYYVYREKRAVVLKLFTFPECIYTFTL